MNSATEVPWSLTHDRCSSLLRTPILRSSLLGEDRCNTSPSGACRNVCGAEQTYLLSGTGSVDGVYCSGSRPMSELSFIPGTYEMANSDVLPLAFDMAPLLEEGETASNPATVLTDIVSGETYEDGLSGSPTIDGDGVITQTVSELRGGRRYRLAVSCLTAAGKTKTAELRITCVF